SWNAGATRIYGYTAEEAIGRPWSFVFPADHAGEMRNTLERVRRSRAVTELESDRVTKDGRTPQVATTISPIRGGNGRVLGASAIERDVTERKQGEERQKLLLAELNHRVKNTLSSVLSIASRTLRTARTPEDFRDAFEGRIRAFAKAHELLAASGW